ncbi:MAG: peptidoglycan-binding protein [Solirubrobacteraceae bacterium]
MRGAETPETELLTADADGPPPELPPPADPSRRRRRRLAAGAAIALVALLASVIALSSSGSSTRHSGDTGVPAGDTTATVTRRTLTESSTVDGTLGYAGKLEVFDRLGGTFTWLPAVGGQISRGGTLFRINDTPVVLMYGSLPAYRTLKEGISDGPDVTELNENLIDLGYDPYGAIGDLDAFGAGTAAAVKRWQEAEGVPETGEVELGRVVFAPGARRVTEVHVSLGQDPPGAEPNTTPGETSGEKQPESTEPPGNGAAPSQQPPSSGKSPSKAGKKQPAGDKSKGKQPASNGKSPDDKAKAEQPDGKDASSDPKGSEGSREPGGKEASKEPGGGSGAGELAVTTTSTQQVVQLKVKAEQQQLAREGETVTVQLPGGGTVPGRITSVGTVASESKGSGEEKGASSGEGEGATIPVTITLEHAAAHLDEAPVSVELVKSIQREVLAVPATALIATAGGGYAVETLVGDRRVTVAVTPGMFAGGYVQVEGPGVHEGMIVIESQ